MPKSVYFKGSLVCGIGINDAKFHTSSYVEGVHKHIPSYATWKDMVNRAYNLKLQERNPTYKDCSVSPEWLNFSVFHLWHSENLIAGFTLDKDIIIPGNKIYGPNTCAFVSQATNKALLTPDPAGKLSGLPLGVQNFRKKFKAQCSGRHLGTYNSIEEAHKAWQFIKLYDLEQCKLEQTNLKVAEGLQIRIDWLKEAIDNDLETVSLNCKGVSYADSIRRSTKESRSANEGPAPASVAVVEGPPGAHSKAD